MYADLNVRWPGGSPSQAEAQIGAVLGMLASLQYEIVALNIEAATPKAAKQVLATSLTPDVLDRLRARFPTLRILKRVTLVFDDAASTPNLALLAEPGLCDVIAVQPRTEKQLQSCATALDIDLICIATTHRLPFPLRHKLCGAAVSRGVAFEVCYGGTGQPASHLVANAAMLFRAARNRGVVLSSGARRPADVRAPLDVANLAGLWGLAANAAKDSVSMAPTKAATQGYLRSRSAKQAVLLKRQKTEDVAS